MEYFSALISVRNHHIALKQTDQGYLEVRQFDINTVWHAHDMSVISGESSFFWLQMHFFLDRN